MFSLWNDRLACSFPSELYNSWSLPPAPSQSASMTDWSYFIDRLIISTPKAYCLQIQCNAAAMPLRLCDFCLKFTHFLCHFKCCFGLVCLLIGACDLILKTALWINISFSLACSFHVPLFIPQSVIPFPSSHCFYISSRFSAVHGLSYTSLLFVPAIH